MKKFALVFAVIIGIAILTTSCSTPKSQATYLLEASSATKYMSGDFPHYSTGVKNIVPDSLRGKVAELAVDLTAKLSNKNTFQDKEDLEDVIEQAQVSAERIYEIPTPGLYKWLSSGPSDFFIPVGKMNPDEIRIYNELALKK